ncbi:acyl carrier protein [Prodigiosinella confusarubida]|uniref:Acyl carrier protein n=2 Tax=Serratia sp. (strain ATCC 39006) TaxID=104623 RepID=A0A2I5TEX1_SERS3|nr:acyl carrier protein [Serratia sp. ATCC 39006]AUH03121.1 acyl carrier protein [Serratia sp. ATCC 39006]
MDKNEIYQEITGLLIKLFDLKVDDIKPESRLYEDLELDSIDAVDMVVHLQKRIGRKISAETFKSVRTVQDVVDAVESLINEG